MVYTSSRTALIDFLCDSNQAGTVLYSYYPINSALALSLSCQLDTKDEIKLLLTGTTGNRLILGRAGADMSSRNRIIG